MLLTAGVVTAVPLLLFSAGARLVPMTVLGILQYIAPSIGFLIGIYIFHEPFSQSQLVGYSSIWLALVIFTMAGTLERRRLQLALRTR